MRKRAEIRTRNPVGWGYLENAITPAEINTITENLKKQFSLKNLSFSPGLISNDIQLSKVRVNIPAYLSGLLTNDHTERLLHAVGRSYRDLVKLREASILEAPDAVGYPRNETDLLRILEYANAHMYAVIPFGGGSGVVGGVNPEGMEKYQGVITVDMQKMNQVISISKNELVVHAEAGILGPDLDKALRENKMHSRYSPQSFHHSTLGGWIAARGAGHNSTVHQKIEDRVQSVSGILSDGRRFSTRPLPGTSIAVDPKSYWMGSEGFLGFITNARLRVYDIPEFRGFRALSFGTFAQAITATRAISQSGIFPVQIRVLDEDENAQTAMLAGVNPQGKALMIIGDESSYPVVEERLATVSNIAAQYGGKKEENSSRLLREWIRLFFRQPYFRDFMISSRFIVDTFETAIGYDHAHEFYREIKGTVQEVMGLQCGQAHVGCRITHSYPDGLCLYFSFYAPGKAGKLTDQWRLIKDRATQAVIANGGTASHHHAMGRDHRPYSAHELSGVHRDAIGALKRELDPKSIMNPGVWFAG